MTDSKGNTQSVSTAGFNETPRFYLEQPTGDVLVEGWDRPEIAVTVDDEDAYFELEQNGSQVTVRNKPGKFNMVNFLEPAEEELRELGVDIGRVASRVERSLTRGVERGMRRMGRGFNFNVDLSAWRGGRDYNIKVPHDCDLTLRTSSGDMEIRGINGTMLIQSSTGDIRVGDVSGNLLVNSASGDIRVEGHEGKLGLRTASGDVSAKDLHVDEVSATTASGDLQIDLVSLPDRPFELRTVSGEITLFVPADSEFRAEVSTITGSVTSGFPRNQVQYAPGSKRETVLQVNGGGLPVKLVTVSGDVTIRPRRVKAPSEQAAAPHVDQPGAPTMDLSRSHGEADRTEPERYVARQNAELEVLQMVQRGEITPQEALDRLAGLDS